MATFTPFFDRLVTFCQQLRQSTERLDYSLFLPLLSKTTAIGFVESLQKARTFLTHQMQSSLLYVIFRLLSSLRTGLCLLNVAVSGGDIVTRFYNEFKTNSLTVFMVEAYPLVCIDFLLLKKRVKKLFFCRIFFSYQLPLYRNGLL